MLRAFPGGRPRFVANASLLVAALVVASSCSGPAERRSGAGGRPQDTVRPPAPSRPAGEEGQRSSDTGAPAGALILSSGFERPVCGVWYQVRAEQCEFGVEGSVESGPFSPRTGASNVRIDRSSPKHMGVIAAQPLPGGRAFVGAAHRVPDIPAGAIPRDPGYLELEQLSPTDGTLNGYPVEVRLYPDRRLGLGLYRGKEVSMVDWPVPVDDWFYLVVEVENGAAASQRLWVYDSGDGLVGETAITLQTQRSWPNARRVAQKLGGATATRSPLYTYVDDWVISRDRIGPLRVDSSGRVYP